MAVSSWLMYLSENDTIHGDRQGAQIEIDTPFTDEVEPSAIPALADASSLTDKPIYSDTFKTAPGTRISKCPF